MRTIVDQSSRAIHKLLLLLVVTGLDLVFNVLLDFLVSNDLPVLFLLLSVLQGLVLLLVLDLIGQIVVVIRLVVQLLFFARLQVRLVGFLLTPDYRTPFIELAILIHGVVAFKLVLIVFDFLLLFFQRFLNTERS
jgi:hypothetical protein